MRVRVANLAEHGVVLDREDISLPQNAFTVADNIEFNDGVARKAHGAISVLDGVAVKPEWLVPYLDPDTGVFYWVICGVSDTGDPHIVTWDGVTQTFRTALTGASSLALVSIGSPGNIFDAAHGLADGDLIEVLTTSIPAEIPLGQYAINYLGPDNFDLGITITAAGNFTWQQVGPALRSGNTVWNGGNLNGLVFINPGGGAPQKWDRTGTALNDYFEDFANWPAGDTAEIMRPFRNFIVAMDVTKSGAIRNPYLVRWSDAAEPFSEPPAWDAAPGNLAGEFTMSDEGGYIIDALPLRGSLIIYRQTQTYILRYTQGVDVMSVDQLFSEFGLLTARCVKAFGDGKHFVVSAGDIFVHNGNTAQSIANQKVRSYIFDDIDTDNYKNAFVTPNYPEEEMWFCYPSKGSTIPNKAARWSWKYNAWSFTDITGSAHIGYGVIPATTATDWNSDSGQWNADTTIWNEGNANPTISNLLVAFRNTGVDTAANSKLLQGDFGNQYNGSNMVVKLERTGLSGITAGGQGVEDPTIDKDIQAIWPKIDGGPVDISVGASVYPGGPYTWDGPYSFDPLTDEKVDVRVSGKYYATRFESNANVEWSLSEYVIELEAEGER